MDNGLQRTAIAEQPHHHHNELGRLAKSFQHRSCPSRKRPTTQGTAIAFSPVIMNPNSAPIGETACRTRRVRGYLEWRQIHENFDVKKMNGSWKSISEEVSQRGVGCKGLTFFDASRSADRKSEMYQKPQLSSHPILQASLTKANGTACSIIDSDIGCCDFTHI